MASSSRTRRRAPAIALAALFLLPSSALAGTARVDHVADGTPTVVFQGGGEVNTVGVSRVVPSALNEIDYFFSDSNPITAGAGCSQNGSSNQVKCVIPGRSESFGHIRLGGGNDNTNVGFENIALDGEAGDDHVGGHVGISGGPGNDTITGTSINDVFFVKDGDGTDTIDGGGGANDALRLENAGTLNMRGTPDTITGVEELDGSFGDDTIIADDRVIDSATGTGWTVTGSNGDDHLVAAPNTRTIVIGNDGADHIEGGAGNDQLIGADGDDLIEGNGGNDSLDGGDDRDTLDGGAGTDTFQGGDGEDLVLSVDSVAEDVRCGFDTDRTIADDIDMVDADCELTGLDSDGDGLKDDWELHGLDVDGDGHVDVDLPAMGAKVNRKDVFVELDFMPPHKLAQAAIAKVVAAFKAAPVANPDGTTGITLHVDNGPTSVMNPVTGAKWGSRSKQSSIAHQAQTGSVTNDTYDWSPFDALKAANFDPKRAPVFHYAISAHAHDGTFSGISRGVGASDFLVTLGAGCQALNPGPDCTLDADGQAGTFMHELGHNLGLRHGGGDDVGYKPNYLSVMNYAYQLPGLLRANLTTRIDYSRFALSADETALDENTGFGVPPAGPGADLLATVRCPNNSQHLETLLAGTIDFDCNGTIKATGTVAVDINHDGDTFRLDGFEDWPALSYVGGAIGAEGRPVDATSVEDEVPLQELAADRKTIDDYIAAHQPPPGGGGPGPAPGGGPSTTPPAQTAAVRLSTLRVKRAAHHRLKITYRLSRSATVVFRIQRRKGHRWVTLRGSFKHASKAGRNTFRISAKRLKKGRYRLVARPRGGSAVRAKFAVSR